MDSQKNIFDNVLKISIIGGSGSGKRTSHTWRKHRRRATKRMGRDSTIQPLFFRRSYSKIE